MAKYRIDAIQPTTDGTGDIAWTMTALDDDGVVLPRMEVVIKTPASETAIALDDPNPREALLALLGANAPDYFLPAALDARVAANAASQSVAGGVYDFVQETPYVFDA